MRCRFDVNLISKIKKIIIQIINIYALWVIEHVNSLILFQHFIHKVSILYQPVANNKTLE